MAFKRSIWWGLIGGVALSVLAFALLASSKRLSEIDSSFLLWLGLNPREQGLWCFLLEAGVTFAVGFIAGRGLSIFRNSQPDHEDAA